ncbi:MAG TPA: 50S ribosomal protein L25/general stress protein Ctc [Mycobacteriales bacterium]|nr:50S ribosomal protein L25/general stress protein Ctc [Mycobacteriales bacterium]
MSEVRIAAEPRTEFGKGYARRIRAAAKVPAVLYGHGDAPRHFSLPGHELMLALKHDSNVLLALQTSEGEQLALPKVVVRDPIKGHLEHVDLVAVRRGERVTVEVPITLTGQAGPDTLVEQQTMTLTVEADATNLPDHVEVSIEGLSAGSSVSAGEVPLPEGTTLVLDAQHVIVAILGQVSEEELEAELAHAEADAGAGAIGVAQAEAAEMEASGETGETGDADTESSGSEAPAE